MKKKVNITKMILIVMFVYVSYVLVSTQLSMQRIKTETEASQQEVDKLTDVKQKLQGENDYKNNNLDQYIERQAREKLGLIKEGETPVIDKK